MKAKHIRQTNLLLRLILLGVLSNLTGCVYQPYYFWYVDKNTGSDHYAINCLHDSLQISISRIYLKYLGCGGFKREFETYISYDSSRYKDISICFDSMVLNTFISRSDAEVDRKTEYCINDRSETNISIRDTCISNSSGITFYGSKHFGSDSAIFEVSFKLVLNGLIKDKKTFKYYLTKKGRRV